jgi:hypothetical protein
VTTNVREHTNDKVPLRRSDYLDFLKYMMGHGLSFSTMRFIATQLVNERITKKNRWRRAVILDRLQFDLFRWYYRKLDPHFATFFLNSTAHFQHLYWRNMDPHSFQVQPTKEDQDDHEQAVLYGYQQMDWIVGQVLAMAGNRTIIFSSALGQQPCLKYEDQGGKVFYRPRDIEGFVKYVGITAPHQIVPVMSEEFHILFEREADAVAAEAILDQVRVNGRQGIRRSRNGSDVLAGCGIFDQLPADATMTTATNPTPVSFFDHLYQAEGMKSGMHHPDGLWWVRGPDRRHVQHDGKVPLKSCAPTILDLFGVEQPDYMSGESLMTGSTPRRGEPAVA